MSDEPEPRRLNMIEAINDALDIMLDARSGCHHHG